MLPIETVRGPVGSADLGITLMHEHIFAKHPELEQNYPSPEWDEEAMITRARDGLEELAALGVTTLVDLTVMGLGRHIPRIQCVAEGLDIDTDAIARNLGVNADDADIGESVALVATLLED